MSYYYDDDRELEAKVGQFLYNLVITERLREYLVQRVRDRESLSLRIELGRDGRGNLVVMDVLISRIPPSLEEVKRSQGEPEPTELPGTKTNG